MPYRKLLSNRSLATLGVVLLSSLTLLAGCGSSFEEAIKPVIDNTPSDTANRVYVTGTRAYSSSDDGSMSLNVWRVNAEPFPDSVLIYARVMTPDGTFISNLAPPYYTGGGDYKAIWSGLKEQIGAAGKTYEIDDFHVREFSDKDGIPFELALTLDYSGSMGENIVFLESAARTFINLKLPQDRISVIKFDDTPKLVAGPSTSKQELLADYGTTGLNGFGGYTALYAAAKLGADQVATAPKTSPRALILFTDGEDNGGGISSDQLFDYCVREGIPVFSVAFGAVNSETLQSLSVGTGGRFYQTNDPKELEKIFKDIYLSLRNYYLISYKPPRVDGKHLVTIALNPPGGGQVIGANAEYLTYGTVTVPTIDTETPFANDVFFAYNSAVLLPEAMPIIEQYADAMRKSETMRLEVQGHTDSVGTEAYNDTLSIARANAVREAFIAKGIGGDRIRARGFGESRPTDTNGTEDGRRRNRRTEFIILRR